MYTLEDIKAVDPQIADAITAEFERQSSHIELIASENIVSPAVMAAMGTVLTNKYAEGYPGHRYYGGCADVDIVENIARERACRLFGAEHANVQPHSGSQANAAVYAAFLQPGDKILGFDLSHGGHLTHGSPVNFSGKLYKTCFYGVEKETGRIDYDKVAEIAQRYADSMASVTVKSTDATHPQNGMSFGDLGETDLMEIGAGQHGEGGGVRVPMMSAKDTVATVAEALSKKLELKAGDKAFVMINGCGATTMMEMLVLFKDTVEFLKAKGIEVVASMVGEILTVQEAAGFQMNIAKWDDEFLRLWNTPAHTPAFFKE